MSGNVFIDDFLANIQNPSLSKMKKLMRNLCIFDGRNQYDPEYLRQNGFEYKGIGR